MKVSLVVATGAHEGRVIPITGPQFLIGRDPQCHLRPASQAISKLHCGVLVRDGRVYVKDFGSTNGTLVNDSLVQGAELVVGDGTLLRVGPLDFRIRVEKFAAKPDGTPLPTDSAETAAAVAAAKAAAAKKSGSRDATPSPIKPASDATPQPSARPEPVFETPRPSVEGQPATQPMAPVKLNAGKDKLAGQSRETPMHAPAPAPAPAAQEALPSGSKEVPSLTTSESVTDEDQDRIAAILLGMDEDGNGKVPDGSTVMDIPNPLAEKAAEAAKAEEKKNDKKPVQSREDMSNTANELLRKYMRRPR